MTKFEIKATIIDSRNNTREHPAVYGIFTHEEAIAMLRCLEANRNPSHRHGMSTNALRYEAVSPGGRFTLEDAEYRF